MADDAPDTNDFTGRYNTPLSQPEQDSFNGWVKDQSDKTGRSVGNDLYDYDLQGWWQMHAGDTEDGPQLSGGHLTDEFKKPNHPTFSDQSKYHGLGGNEGGAWEKIPGGEPGVEAWSFKPGGSNLDHHGPDRLKSYFDKVEPGNQLILPEQPHDFGAPGQIDRSRIRSELEQNPALRERLKQMVMGEVGSRASPEVRRIQMETAMNRALARDHSFDQVLWDTAGHGNRGYYPRASFTRGGHDEATFAGDLEAVLAGSNYAGKYGKGLITGNASADVARHQFARGTPGFTLETGSGPESYFSEGPFRTNVNVLAANGGFLPAGAEMQRQGVAELPPMSPGYMSVKSDVSNFPQSGNIADRRNAGPIQRIKDTVNDTYLTVRARLGIDPEFMKVKNPDDRLGSVKDIRDRVGVIRERHQQEMEAYDQAYTDYKRDSEEFFANVDAYNEASSKYHKDMDQYLADFQKALARGQGGKFTANRKAPEPPVDKAGKHPDPEKYFGDTARLRIYDTIHKE